MSAHNKSVRKVIARRLREARIAANLTITAAAEGAKVTRFQWFRFENARVGIPSESLPAIAKVIDVDPADLLPKAA